MPVRVVVAIVIAAISMVDARIGAPVIDPAAMVMPIIEIIMAAGQNEGGARE
jgi:hypothetical protein